MIADPKLDHIPTLTGLRAYAAVWVMLLHLQFGIGLRGHVELGPIVNHGFWAVDVFFVLSGFILSLLYAPRLDSGPPGTYRKYLAARFARIYPLHALALLALAAYYLPRLWLNGTTLPPGFGLGHLALNVSLLHGWGFAERLSWNFPSWSIGSEWFAYLLLPALTVGLRRLPALAVIALALLGWTLVIVLVHGQGELLGGQNVHWALPRIAVEFSMGYGLYRLFRERPPQGAVADVLALGGLVALLAICLMPSAAEWLVLPAVSAMVYGLARPGRLGSQLFGSRAAVFWGERSYSIYMLHAVVQIYCNLALLHLGMRTLDAGAAWALFFAQIGVVLLASHLAYVRVELPMRDWLRRKLGGKRT